MKKKKFKLMEFSLLYLQCKKLMKNRLTFDWFGDHFIFWEGNKSTAHEIEEILSNETGEDCAGVFKEFCLDFARCTVRK